MSLTERITETYKQASIEVKKKLDAFLAANKAAIERKEKELADGKITEAEYKSWLNGQLFRGRRWQEKLDDITKVYVDADKKAKEIVGGTSKNVFAEFANKTAKDITKKFKGAVSFDVYDKRTVERLLKDDPQILPEWKINEPKDYRWNQRRAQNAITQGIVQGESIPKIAKRLSSELSASNDRYMMNFARTAITGAQNAGRVDMLHNAQEKGIKVRKKWLAALDNRTRDAHRDLNGTIVDVDEKFKVKVDGKEYEIDYPGDPTAAPEMVYNCRCTLTYVYPKYQPALKDGGRREQTTGEVIKSQTYREWDGTKKKEPEKDRQTVTSVRDLFKQKMDGFTPASTMEEAEATLSPYVDTQGFGATGVSYAGISLGSANEVNKTIIALQQTFDVDKIGGIVAPAKNTKLGKAVQSAVAGYSPLRNSYILNRETLKSAKAVAEHFATERKTVKDILTHPENYDLTKGTETLRRIIENSKASGRATVPESISDVIAHEFGHSIEPLLKKDLKFDEIKSNMPMYAPKISGYAHESLSEYIAESMASYLKGEDDIDPVLREAFERLRRA